MEPVLAEILEQVTARAARSRPVEICVGVHWTFVAVEIDGRISGGLASTLSEGSHAHAHDGAPAVIDAGHLLSRSAIELAAMVGSARSLEIGIGMATLNALLEVDPLACVEVNAADLIAERGAGRNVAVVGHFPFIPRLHEVAGTLWVLELNPRAGDLPAEAARDILPRADVVAITGTSLLNGTFGALVALCRPDAYVLLLGATTPLSPVLFQMGVDALAGTLVVDPERVRLAVSQGATFRQIPGKRLLTMLRA
ncbi:MAG: DUF364 domain-containing protein [Anaerolineae bacterium]|nr:DUF364 domain-containing protein [Anaerolineae bacterium]